ncbi:MAG: hypothetical protein NC254_07960 [bacterium]|nr:hypothetical protein [bacterium]
MALTTVAILAIIMCDVVIRFFTKNIVYDNLHVDSAVIRFLVDGLVSEQEGTAVVIDWNEAYPREVRTIEEKEDRTFGVTGVWNAFDQKMRGITCRYTEIIDYYCTDGLRDQPRIAELASEYDNLIGWRLVMADGLMVNENGYLGHISTEKVETAELVDSVAKLHDLVVSEGGIFCYVQVPSNVCKYEEGMVGTFVDYGNENADHLLSQLSQRGIPYLDLREALHTAQMGHREAFYRTDLHWTVPTAFWAADVITQYLTQISEIRFESEKYAPDQYEMLFFENNFLGGNGRTVTLKKAQPENFELLLPAYATRFTMEIPSRQMYLEGDFKEVFIFDEPLTSYDYYGEDSYDSYRTRNYPLIRIHNQNTENNRGKRLLIIRDSFSAPLIPYLAVDIEYVDCLYLESFNGSVKEYIRQTQPDIVLVAYCPPNIKEIDWDSDSSMFDFR